MTTGEKIAFLRKEQQLTQEQLADYLDVSRQSVSKWEMDVSFPETEKLIKLSILFHCSIDSLLTDKPDEASTSCKNFQKKTMMQTFFTYQYKSNKTLLGKRLVHVSMDPKVVASAWIAIGIRAKGFLSIGLLCMGFLSIGLLSLGAIAIGNLVFGLFSMGVFSFGIVSFGAIAFGLLTACGAIAIGNFAFGALAIGNYLAVGDVAYGQIALASSYAQGTVFSFCSHLKNTIVGYDIAQLTSALYRISPSFLHWIIDLLLTFLPR